MSDREKLAIWLHWRSAHYWPDGQSAPHAENSPWAIQRPARKTALRKIARDILSGAWRREPVSLERRSAP